MPIEAIFIGLLATATLTLWVPAQWCRTLFEVGMMALAGYHIVCRRISTRTAISAVALAVPGMLGFVQIAAGATIDKAATLTESLQWLGLAATLLNASVLERQTVHRKPLILVLATTGAAIAAFAILQFYTSQGKIFWLWPSRDPQVFGPFHNRNNFAAFVCLILPVTLWFSVESRRVSGLWTAASVVLAAGVVTSGSRAGLALVAAEVAMFLLYWLTTDHRKGKSWRALLVGGGVLCGAAVVGWDTFAHKLQDSDPLRYRREMAASATAMTKSKPGLGYGLATFSLAYPAYATFDTGYAVNYAHNDWLEFAAEGGIWLALFLAGAALWTSRLAFRYPWALGIPVVCLHALVDYPLQRIGVSAWLVALAASLLYYSRHPTHRQAVRL